MTNSHAVLSTPLLWVRMSHAHSCPPPFSRLNRPPDLYKAQASYHAVAPLGCAAALERLVSQQNAARRIAQACPALDDPLACDAYIEACEDLEATCVKLVTLGHRAFAQHAFSLAVRCFENVLNSPRLAVDERQDAEEFRAQALWAAGECEQAALHLQAIHPHADDLASSYVAISERCAAVKLTARAAQAHAAACALNPTVRGGARDLAALAVKAVQGVSIADLMEENGLTPRQACALEELQTAFACAPIKGAD